MSAQLVLFDTAPLEYRPASFGSLCLDCTTDVIAIGEYYMLEDVVWLEANPRDRGMLCVGCLEARIGRRLTWDDFTGAPCNSGPKSERLHERMEAE